MTPPRSEVPEPAVRRLSLYLRQLEALKLKQVTTISSRRLADSLDLTDAQVRKDLAYFGQFGRPGVGYEVIPLITRLRQILGTDRVIRTILIGAGNLGSALASYHRFATKGFEMVGVFDSDPARNGEQMGHLTVQPMAQLNRAVRDSGARLAIMAVPADAAQSVADQLVKAGVRGILNFAPVRVTTPDDVTVHDIDMSAELEQLSFRVNMTDVSDNTRSKAV
ncbi:MAG: redox-sensing transcriptional repressor Rex [Phycisphaera sp.]|nr:redox-sensing transcriptional repressor Rex [Phycisphaera sp.]